MSTISDELNPSGGADPGTAAAGIQYDQIKPGGASGVVAAQPAAPAGLQITYHNGRVLKNVLVRPVFWGSAWTGAGQPLSRRRDGGCADDRHRQLHDGAGAVQRRPPGHGRRPGHGFVARPAEPVLEPVYFVLGSIVSHINESPAGALNLRPKDLERGVNTLPGAKLAGCVLKHPLVAGLGGRPGRSPSYIPASVFSLALFDTLLQDSPDRSLQAIRDSVAKISDDPGWEGKAALATLVTDAGTDIDKARTAVESWFSAGMDRVSGVYRGEPRG